MILRQLLLDNKLEGRGGTTTRVGIVLYFEHVQEVHLLN